MDNFSISRPVNMAPTGIATFAKCPICLDLNDLKADIAIIGAPSDIGMQGKTRDPSGSPGHSHAVYTVPLYGRRFL